MQCTRCRIGHYHATTIPYITFLNDQMLVLPNISAFRCDMCGDVHFNQAFLDQLQYLLDQLTQAEEPMEPAEWLALNDHTTNWQSSGRMV